MNDYQNELDRLRRRIEELEVRPAGDERNEAAEALFESREWYRNFFENAAVAVAIVDQKGHVVEANDADCRFLGYSRSELIGMHFSRFTHPQDLDVDVNLYQSLMNGERQGYEIEKRYVRKDGEVVWGRLAVSLIRDSQGMSAFTLVVCVDVTERKRAQEELQKSEERLNFMMSKSPAVIFTCRPSGEFGATFVTPNVQHQLGYDPRTFTSNPGFWAAHIHPDDKQRIFDGLSALFATGSHVHEYRFRHKDGTWRWMHDELRLIRDETGAPLEILGSWLDITDRKRAEQALAVSEERHRLLLDMLSHGVQENDCSGVITYSNRTHHRILGYENGELVGKAIWQLLPPGAEQESLREYLAYLVKEQPKPSPYFTVSRKKDGSLVDLQIDWDYQHDIDGSLKGFISVITDVTVSKKAEENLRHHAQGLATLLEVSRSLAVTLDLEKVLQAATDGVTKVFGFDTAAVYLIEEDTLRLGATTPPLPPRFPEELRNAPLADHPHVRDSLVSGKPVFVPDLVTADLTPAERAVAEQRDLRTVLFLPLIAGVKPVGSLIVGSVAKPRAISEAEIDLCRTLANLAALAAENALLYKSDLQYAADLEQRMAERKQAEEALQESEEKFRAVFDSASDGILVVDPRTKRFVLGNATIARMLGVGEEDIPVMKVEDIHPPEALQDVLQAFGKVARGETPFSENIPVMRKDGSMFIADISTSWIKLKGETYLAGFFRDVTERKETERERLELERRLLHAQKLESLGILAGGIAHDFNNLLMAVLGNLDLALRNLSPVSPARANIEQSVQAAHRATDLTRQMLAYSGKGRFVVKAMDLSELVEENAHLLRASVARTATLDVHLGRSLPLIEADAGQMQQVIMNLITNASEAIGDNSGRITILTGVQECDAQCLKQSRNEDVLPAARFVYLEVSDTGCGMDEQTKRRLFDPFFTTKAPGRGLGMSAILGIVRGHGGAIFVESEPGRGTSIRILFPALEGPQAESGAGTDARAAEAGAPPVKGTVLVVDDEEIVRMVCREMVESLGLPVLTAVDGRDAVDLFGRHADSISHVILDLSMPNMDGMSAFTELVRIKPGVKVILSSGYDEQDAIQKMSSRGLAGFIQKPYTLKALRDALEKAG